MVDLLDVVCCPNCQGDIKRLESRDKGLEKGYVCEKCRAEFREKEGILILISKELEDELRS